MIGGTLPIEVAVLYFFLGITAAAFVPYRLQEKYQSHSAEEVVQEENV
jgi:hypothetical protein